MLALALLIALDTPQVAFISDEQMCAGESVASDVARFANALPLTAKWAELPKLDDVSVIVLTPTTAQLALDRGAFMKLMHAQLDAVRAVAPKKWVVIAVPSHASLWLNAIMHKRGDGALSFVVFPKANTTRDECTARAVAIAKEVQLHASPGTSPGAPR